MERIFFVALFALSLAACDENLESAEFNVYFYYPDNREVALGVVRGLSSCQSLARSKASSLKMSRADWSYICCKKTSSSSCESKHR